MKQACDHEYGRWAWPIGQAKIRRCRKCGRIQSWAEYLRWRWLEADPMPDE